MKRLGYLFLFLVPAVVSAHAFGQQYTLPLPVGLYIFGGVAALVISCGVLFFISEPKKLKERAPEAPLTLTWLEHGWAKALLVLALVVSVGFGIFGPQDLRNPLPALFWVVLLLVFFYCNAVASGMWRYLDPFRAAALWLKPGSRPLPKLAEYLPTAWLVGLLWLEFLSRGLGAQPWVLSVVLCLYLVVALAGYSCFGQAWFEHADFFTVLFRLIGKCDPFYHLVQEHARPSELLLLVVLLGGTILDGLSETLVWAPVARVVPGVVALALLSLSVLALYALALWLMRAITNRSGLFLRFGYSLIPIAIAYHFAHYFSLIPSALFGVVVPADIVWYVQLMVIVGGHIVAAVVAHEIARGTFGSKRQVVLSQLPMVVLMVAYTAFGLWTLAQPFA